MMLVAPRTERSRVPPPPLRDGLDFGGRFSLFFKPGKGSCGASDPTSLDASPEGLTLRAPAEVLLSGPIKH